MAERASAPSPSWPRIALIAGALLVGMHAINARSVAPADVPAPAPATPEGRARIAPTQLAALGPPEAIRGERGSLLNVGRKMEYGQYLWNEEGVPLGPLWVRVDLDAQLISVFRGGHEIGTAVILYGADEKPTPTGSFGVIAKLKDHRSNLYDAAMPYTLRLTRDGIAIHGSDVAEGAATHGCIGIPTAFAALLFERATVGNRVTIV